MSGVRASGRGACLLAIALHLAPSTTLARAAQPTAELLRCRELRIESPADALSACERAAAIHGAAASGADLAFEAWMHAAEAASQLGQRERAEAALDAAVPLLANVGDALAAQRLARRRGLLAYRAGQPVAALSRLLEALAVARASADPEAIAISENDLGVIHRHLGNHAVALGHFQASLALREQRGESGLGVLLANIGSLYLELGDHASARRDLQRALSDHLDAGRALHVLQTREELARLDEREGRIDAARTALLTLLAEHAERRSPRDELRLRLRLAEFERHHGDAATAQSHLAIATQLIAVEDRPSRLHAALIAAKLASTPEARVRAYDELAAARVAARGLSPLREAEAETALADLSEASGRATRALLHLREAHSLHAALQASRHGERLDALRVRFDVARIEAERDRLSATAARQEAELERGRRRIVLLGAAAAIVLALSLLLMQARLHRQRLRASAERLDLEHRISEARKAAASLRSHLRPATWLLQGGHEAALVFDAAGSIRAATGAAAAALNRAGERLEDRRLADLLGEAPATWAQDLVEAASLRGDAVDTELGRRDTDDGRLRLSCRRLELEEELGLLRLDRILSPAGRSGPAPAEAVAEAAAGSPLRDAAPAQPDGEEAGAARAGLRERLVALMQASLDAWERVTRRSRIDLAEASGVWRITVDDGRLRVRAFDRYLRIDSVPERPRWREVLRTAYFVLAEVPLESARRAQLEVLVEEVLGLVRERDG